MARQPGPTARTPDEVRTKSRRGIREMPFLPIVWETLEAHLASELRAGRGQADDFVFVTRTGRPFTRQNVSERGIEEAGVSAGLGEGIRAQVLRHSFCTFVAESDVPSNEAAALTGHTEAVWWKSYAQPRRDAESRRENIQRMTARSLGVRGEVDQRLTSG